MLNQLVESKNDTHGNRKLGGILLTTSIAVVTALTVALIGSLFNHSLAMGSENLDLTAMVNPVNPPDEAPPEPAQQQPASGKTVSQLPTRQAHILRIEETSNEIPKTVSVVKSPQMPRPAGQFEISNENSSAISSSYGKIERNDGSSLSGSSLADKTPVEEVKNEIPPPPVIKQIPKAEPKKERLVSGGVLNSKAVYLAKPTYSAAARAVRAKGQVKVQVMIDEDGKVIAANIIDGHPLLQSDALRAAKSSTFTPTYLSNQKVKVSGVIVYNFVDQ